MAGDRSGHAPDRPGACDQNVFGCEVELERRVSGVAEGIEYRAHFQCDMIGQREDVRCRDCDALCKRPGPINPDPEGVGAEVSSPGPTIAAMPTCEMAFARHPLAHHHIGHGRADRRHDAAELVPRHHPDRNGGGGPLVPVVDVQIRAADRGVCDVDENVVRAEFRLGHFRHLQAGGGRPLHESSHATSPISEPMAAKAATVRSMSSSVWAAFICVLIRAVSFGTTGYEKAIT